MSDGSSLRTNLTLLQYVQDYLRAQFEHRTPDSLVAQCWDEFYRVYNELICRFVGAWGLRGADADDCRQAVWLEVATRLDGFDHPRERPGLRAWLYSIVRSKANDFFRKRNRHRVDSLDDARAAGAEPAHHDQDEQLERRWQQALLDTMLEDLRQELSERNVRLLQMRLIEQRDVAATAAELGLSSEQVWYRQHRLLKKLRARLALYTGDAFGAGAELATDVS